MVWIGLVALPLLPQFPPVGQISATIHLLNFDIWRHAT